MIRKSFTIIIALFTVTTILQAQATTGSNPKFRSIKTQGSYFSGRTLGTVDFENYATGSFTVRAAVRAIMMDTLQDGSLPTDLAFFTDTNQSLKERMRITSDGRVGINTSQPSGLLTIQQYLENSPTSLLFQTIGGTATSPSQFRINQSNNGNLLVDLEGDMVINRGGLLVQNQDVTIASGNLMVNTNVLPVGYTAAFNGSVIATELVIERFVDWPDYVFESDYDRMTLEEIEAYIIQHGHLPGIPSAEEIAENGFSVGEMQALSMEKIEELFLHLIEENKRINTQNQTNLLRLEELSCRIHEIEYRTKD